MKTIVAALAAAASIATSPAWAAAGDLPAESAGAGSPFSILEPRMDLDTMVASANDPAGAESPSTGAQSPPEAPARGPASASAISRGARAVASAELSSSSAGRGDRNMARAKQLVDAGKYREASNLLFQMSRSPRYERDSAQIKYVLGLMLFEMKMYQSAAFVFYDLVREQGGSKKRGGSSRYLKQGLTRLALAADYLDSDVLLKYAIKQVDENDFPAANRDMLYYRLGELKMYDKNYDEAARLFARVGRGSLFYAKAKYRQGLAYAEAKQPDRAVYAFEQLAEASVAGGVTDRNRVNALLGKARALYQKQAWNQALEAYRQIPRDTEQWHEALFEESWAELRSARFRSAISDFQSLHSAFYEDFYQPESLLLRAIVYLYICRYDEMDKVLELFARVYRPLDQSARSALNLMNDPAALYNELAKTQANFEAWKANKAARKGSVIPFILARKVLKEGDVRRSFSYLQKLGEERKRLDSQPPAWKDSGVGRYSGEVLRRRMQATQVLAGRQIRRHMILLVNDLRDLFEQSDLLKFERLSGKKEALKKEIAGKGLSKKQIEDETQRDYLIQNGYEYWPFKGEYWLDEIGNYHFVGTQACE